MSKEKCPWESRELGCDEKYVEIASEQEMEMIDKSLSMVSIKVRLPEETYQYLINEADKAGLNLQAFIRNKISSK